MIPLHPLGASDLLGYFKLFIMLIKAEFRDWGRATGSLNPSSCSKHRGSWCIAWGIEHLPVTNRLRMLLTLTIAGEDEDVDLSYEDRIPIFWTGDRCGEFAIADVTVLLVDVCFGAVHCIA